MHINMQAHPHAHEPAHTSAHACAPTRSAHAYTDTCAASRRGDRGGLTHGAG